MHKKYGIDLKWLAVTAFGIGCKVVISHHHDFKAVDGPAIFDPMEKEFLSRVPDGRFIRPEHGRWIHL